MGMMKHQIFCLAAIALTMAHAGCAWHVNLKYKPLEGVESANFGGGRQVAVAKFEDKRTRREIGELRDRSFIKVGSAYSWKKDLGSWVADAVEKELDAHGFLVSRRENAATSDFGIAVSGNISACYVDFVMSDAPPQIVTDGYMTLFQFSNYPRVNLTIGIQITQEGNTILNRTYRVYKQYPWLQDYSWWSVYSESLNLALMELIHKFLGDFADMLKSHGHTSVYHKTEWRLVGIAGRESSMRTRCGATSHANWPASGQDRLEPSGVRELDTAGSTGREAPSPLRVIRMGH